MSEKTREKILSILKATPYITVNELAEIVGISQKGIEWQIARFKKEGIIKRICSDKGGHWGDKMKSENANNATLNHNNIPEDWKKVKLGEGVTSNKNNIGKDYLYPVILYLDTGSITEGKIEGFQKYELNNVPSRAKRLVKEKDIIYSTVRPIQRHYGFIINPPKNLVVSTGFSVIETNQDKAEPKFIYYLLTSNEIVETLDVIADGSTSAYPSLKPSDIENLEIFLPPLLEQKAIASVLSSLDDKIDLLHRQNKTLETMAETLFRQWFVEDFERMEFKQLKLLVSVIDNRGKTPPYQNILTEYPVIEVNALVGDTRIVNYSVIRKYVLEETFKTWFRSHPKKFDILLSTVGSIGEISMFLIEKGSIAQNVIALSPSIISPFYLYQFLKYSQKQIMQLDIGGVQPSIKIPHLLSMLIPMPTKEKQKIFDEQLIDLTSKIEFNYKLIRTLEKLRDTLLPKLMSGEVRVDYNGSP